MKITRAFPVWTLEEGLAVIRRIQQDTRKFGYHVAIGGGVVNTGLSNKDLDLYFLPLDNAATSPSSRKLQSYLEEQFGELVPINAGYYGGSEESAYTLKLKTVADPRIDFFIL